MLAIAIIIDTAAPTRARRERATDTPASIAARRRDRTIRDISTRQSGLARYTANTEPQESA